MKIAVIILTILAVMTSCSAVFIHKMLKDREPEIWTRDFTFSDDLLEKESALDFVDSVRIYKSPDEHFSYFHLSNIKRAKLIGEIRDKDQIKEFYKPLSKYEYGATTCYGTSIEVYVLAFDRSNLRIGDRWYDLCRNHGKYFATTDGIHYIGDITNYNLPEFLIKCVYGAEK